MKYKILPAVVAALALSITVQAQITKGIRAGVAVTNWRGDASGTLNDVVKATNGVLQTAPKTSFYAGGFINIPVTDAVSIEPGINYTQKGYVLRGNLSIDKLNFLGANAGAKVESQYIDISVVLKVQPAKGLQIFAGPQLSYLVKSNLKVDAGILGISLLKRSVDLTNNFNRIDAGVTGGIGYQFANGLSITGSYDRGLSRLDKNSNLKAYNEAFKVGLGFSF
jgi:Outer membrane protein beta-barrel domain